MPELAQAHVKGAALRELARWLQAHFGEHETRRVLDRIAQEHRAGLDAREFALGVLASRWYPVAALHALLDALLEDPDCPPRATLAEEIARHIMSQTLRGVYQLLFRWMATPERYARYASKLWRSYYDHGTFAVVADGPQGSRTTIADWQGHHPLLCELNVAAAAMIYEQMGCREVQVSRTACVDEGAHHCAFAVTWR